MRTECEKMRVGELKKRWKLLAAAALLAAFAAGCGAPGSAVTAADEAGADAAAGTRTEAAAERETGQGADMPSHGQSSQAADGLADASETASPLDVVEDGMTPVYADELADGVYPVEVDSSSSMFKITECSLTVSDGQMEAVMTMGGKGYLKVFMGTGEEALKASEDEFIPYEENETGAHTFRVPVEALDMGIDCSAFSKNKEKWYDRILVFRSDSLPAGAFLSGGPVTAKELSLKDGSYTAEVTVEGGSGRASVQSPASIRVEDGKVWATIVWSSSNYDYMKVDGVKYDLLEGYETSAFEIPVAGFDWKLPVTADTVAMSQPHEIGYTLTFDSESLTVGDAAAGEHAVSDQTRAVPADALGQNTGLSYADQFSIETREDGCSLITIRDEGKFLVVPENQPIPRGLSEDVTVLQRPLDHIYLAATSAMDLFAGLDGVGNITLSGTDVSGWYIGEARKAMERGKMKYAGKYSAPDYELILSDGCNLAIESTMIHHTPEVKEQLERLGIPVLVERSSYESHPLGRLEWVKLYGVLLGKEAEAEAIFEEQESRLRQIGSATEGEREDAPTVAFFYITSTGAANVRKPGDYVAKMIEMAGGAYVPGSSSEHENALSTMNMQMEAFYAAACDADYLIYNSTIDGELSSLKELFQKSPLLADFKAVREGHVWCTGRSMFQETMGVGDMILDIHRMLTEEDPDPDDFTYLYPLK